MRGAHKINCLICKTKQLNCDGYYRGYYSTISDCKKIFDHVCKSCKRGVRKHIQTFEDLKTYRCDHTKTVSCKLVPDRLIRERGYYCKSLYDYIFACKLCMDEIRKEVSLRKRHALNESKRIERRDESLVQKCAKVLVRDPALLLIAATQYPLDENMWKSIHDVVPDTLRLDYATELLESKRTNSRWMYNTISDVFGFYRKIYDPEDE